MAPNVRFNPEVLDRLDIAAATRAEIEKPPTLLPSRTVEAAVEDRVDEYAAYLSSRASIGGLEPPPEVVFARKSAAAVRPILVLSLDQRVLLGALIQLFRPAATDCRPFDDYKPFTNAPVAVDDAEFVVSADVASFYEYIDHDLLLSQLVALSGDYHAALNLVELLGWVMGRAVGVPQSFVPSDDVANIFIDVAERRIARRGVRIWRFNDDFRMVADSRKEAYSLLELLSQELRSLGLVLNERKTYVTAHADYEERMGTRDERIQEVISSVDGPDEPWSLYGGDGLDLEIDEVSVAAAVELLSQWRKERSPADPPMQRSIWRELLGGALSALTVAAENPESAAGTDYATEIFQFEPQMTWRLARYIGELSASHPGAGADALQDLILDPAVALLPWQALWLLTAVEVAPEVPTAIKDWVREDLMGGAGLPGAVRGMAARVAGSRKWKGFQAINGVLQVVDSASKPDALVGLLRAKGTPAGLLDDYARGDLLLKWVAAMNQPQ